MRVFFIVCSIMIFSAASQASCPNINQINNYSSELEESLSELVETIYTHFPQFNFYDLAVRAESDAKFLEFSTRSELLKCSMAKRIFSGLDISFNILRNHKSSKDVGTITTLSMSLNGLSQKRDLTIY